MIREAIGALVEGRSLTAYEAGGAMSEIMDGEATPAQIGAFVTALRVKVETLDEIVGMARVMREKSLRVEVDGPLVDTCGTGGDSSGTFNISTTVGFVAAGAGARVAKHGNRAASGATGSADVLEELGANIGLGPDGVKRCIEKVGFGFMFAQTFHPAMRFAAAPRREIGIRTIFNTLGPLMNPAGTTAKVFGMADPGLAPVVAQFLAMQGAGHALIVHGRDGLDEISLAAPTDVWELKDGSCLHLHRHRGRLRARRRRQRGAEGRRRRGKRREAALGAGRRFGPGSRRRAGERRRSAGSRRHGRHPEERRGARGGCGRQRGRQGQARRLRQPEPRPGVGSSRCPEYSTRSSTSSAARWSG